MEKNLRQKPAERVWEHFARDENLTPEQLEMFKTYGELLLEWNELSNLTALKDLSGVVNQHFVDSIALRKVYDLTKVNSICDVGSGAGFPGLPLKIMFPHLRCALIEVNYKKRLFLTHVIETLKLENVEVVELDWRTFLRSTEGEIDLFVTKAALHEEELIRMFRSNCAYRNAQLIYWATSDWEADPKAIPFIKQTLPYMFKRRERKFIVMGL